MATLIIRENVCEEMFPLGSRAHFSQKGGGTVAKGGGTGLLGPFSSVHCFPGEGLVPEPSGQVSETATAETIRGICHECIIR